MARRKELKYCTFEILEGFDGTGAVNDTLAAAATDMDVDTLVLADSRTVVPVGARFTTAGIATVRTVTATQYSTQYTLDLSASSAGTFTVTHEANTTAGVAYNATAATLQTALEGLASIGAGNVTVTLATSVYTITFAGTLKNTAQTITVDGTGLTAPNSHVLTQVHDGTTTWNITFTPAIATGSVPADDAVITFYPRKVVASIGEGNIEHTKNKDPQVDLDRGTISGARSGNEVPMDVSFSFIYDWLKSSQADSPTVDEALEQEGEAADWISAGRDPCEAYQVTLKVIDKPPCGSEKAEVILYKYFLPRSVNGSIEAAQVNVTGVCAATKPVLYRPTNNDDAIDIIYQ